MPRILRWAVPLLAVFVVALGYAGPTTTSKEKRSIRETNFNPVDGATTLGAFGGSTATPLPAGWWNTTRPAAVGTYTGLSTFYDLQTNGGSPRFIEIDTTRPGHIHVVFTTCEDSNSTSWPTRRVSYARSTDNGVTWADQQSVPTDVRAGFPALDLYRSGAGTGYPVVASHSGGDPIAHLTLIDISGAPAQIELPDQDQPGLGAAIWPSVACAFDGTINMHSSVNLTGLEPQNYINRIDNTLTTWAGIDTFPSVFGGAARSSFAAASDGRVGSIASDDSTSNTYLLESTNNGATWGAPIVVYPAGRVHPSGDSLEVWLNWDMMYTPTDRYMAFSTSNSDGSYARSRIEFYSTATGYVDAVPRDTLLWKSSLAGARTLSVGLPSIGISGSKILIAFVGYLDATPADPISGGSVGDIFLVQSTDGGASWSQAANITNTPTLDEKWVSISRWNENGYANLVWQEDPLAGNTIDGFGDRRASQVFFKADVTNLFPADDITALSVSSPDNGFGVREGSRIAPQGSFRNTGLAGQTNVGVRLEVLNSTPSVVFTSNKTIATMASAATETVTFDSIPNNLPVGLYTLRVMSLLPGDLRPTNDTAYSTINVFPIVAVGPPPSGNRESYHASWDVPSPEGIGGGWYTASSGANDWVLGTPAKPQLSHSHSSPNAWVTKLATNYTTNAESYLASPSFDMSALSGNVTVEFFHNFHIEANWDHATFIYSVDGGLTWLVADSAVGSGPNFNTGISTGWYNEDIDSNEFSTPYQYGPLSWSGGAGTVGQLGSTAYAGHNDGWIRSSTVLPVGGLSDVRFRFNFFSDASANGEGWAIDDFSFGPTTGSSSVGILANWNMISNPVYASNDSVKALYPTSTFAYAFSFGATGYTQDYTMENGTGYWAKFPLATTAVVSGAPVFTYDVPVINGWNMIGSVSSSVDTADILDEPAGIQIGTYFAYSGGYSNAAAITPGQAVWAKMNAPGHLYYTLNDGPIPPSVAAKPTETDAFAGLNKLQITDASGNGTTLYFGSLDNISMWELPPVPPAGAFDARFVTGHMVQTTKKQNAGNVDLPIAIQSIAYPVTVRWDIAAGGEYMLATGLSSSIMRGTGSATISNSSINRVVVSGAGEEALPTSYSLFQNYPNPFNPSTNVKFALPLQSKVNVEIYNLLGQRVRTLVNGEFVAGYHVVEWNGKNDAGQQLSSGVYMLKIAATNADGRSFSDVRKLMMVK